MKKLFAVLLVVCLIGSAAIGFDFASRDRGFGQKAYAAAAQQLSATAEPTAEPVSAKKIDFDAVYALHEPDEVVMTIGGTDVTWDEYFYYLYRQASSVENYMSMMAMYGTPLNWDDPVDESGMSYLEMTKQSADFTAQNLAAIGNYAKENGLEITEADRAAIEEKAQQDYVNACGEGATREDFEAYLATIWLPVPLYDRMNELSVYNRQAYAALFGENGELVSDVDAMTYLANKGYLASNHILFMTIDPATREPLDEETVAAKLQQAQELAAELQAIEDKDERLSVFAERKQALDEDTGKASHPDGYVFLPGTMVSVFEETTRSQEPYQVSDPVESNYGYHVIMTLPLTPDTLLDTGNGTSVPARVAYADEAFSAAMEAYMNEQEIVYAEGFEPPVLTDYLTE